MVRTWAGARPFRFPPPVLASRSSSLFQSSLRSATKSSALSTGPKLPDMQPQPDSDLVVATPERVSFDYQVAGLGTRAIAQVLDLLIVSFILAALYFVAVAISLAAVITGQLIAILGSFVVIFGYFWVSEALWSGQTVGKKAFRL